MRRSTVAIQEPWKNLLPMIALFVVGERVVIRWRYCWGDDDTQTIRGINLMRVRGGQIVEAMGYVKG